MNHLGRNAAAVACFVGAVILLSHCGILKAAGIPGASCPDMSNPEAVAAFDWQKAFQLDAKVAGTISESIPAAVQLNAFVKGIDDDLKKACGGFAADLGAKGEYKDAAEACKAAIKAFSDIREKVGAKAKFSVSVDTPTCTVSTAPFVACAKQCGHLDASVEATCSGGHMYGPCTGECTGECSLEAGGSCEGTCSGTCEADIKGTCKGICNGKCDGKDSHDGCKGRCEGTCVADVKGAKCGGKCQGNCQLKKSGKCQGQCGGKCSADVKAPRCSGSVKLPNLSPKCIAECSLVAVLSSDCLRPVVRYTIKGATDAEAARMLEAAVEKNLPAIFEVAIGLKDKALGAAVSAKKVIEGGMAVSEEIAKATKGDPQKSVMSGALVACIAGPYKEAIEGVVGIKGKIDISLEVKASIGGKAGGR